MCDSHVHEWPLPYETEHKKFRIMQNSIEDLVLQAGDNVQQLAAAVKAQKQLKKLEESVREQATADVEAYLRSNADGFTYAHRGHLDWEGTDIIVKHNISYTWDNYRKSSKPEDQKTAEELELEEKVEMALSLRVFRKKMLDSAQDAANMANATLRAAKTNFRASEQALAQLLPNSKCIHDELQLAIE